MKKHLKENLIPTLFSKPQDKKKKILIVGHGACFRCFLSEGIKHEDPNVIGSAGCINAPLFDNCTAIPLYIKNDDFFTFKNFNHIHTAMRALKVPRDVVWALTKKNGSQIAKW